MKKNAKIILLCVACITILAVGFGTCYNKVQKQRQLREKCETVATKSFMITFGTVEDIHKSCKNTQLQKLYDQNKKKGLNGAILESHQQISATCDCTVKNLYKNVVTPWIDKCLQDDQSWLSESVKLHSIFKQQPTKKLLLIESSYEFCETSR